MNRFDYVDGASIAAFSYGTSLIIRYPATAFTWSFYTGPLTLKGGPDKALSSFLKASNIGFNARSYPIVPGSIQRVKGTAQVNGFNHSVAVNAEVTRIRSAYGPSINGGVATSGKSLSMTNLNGNGRFPDIGFQTRSFWTGVTNRFVEVKTGEQDLKGTRGASAGVQAPADANNLARLKAQAAPFRFLGQGLRVAGVAGAAYDLY